MMGELLRHVPAPLNQDYRDWRGHLDNVLDFSAPGRARPRVHDPVEEVKQAAVRVAELAGGDARVARRRIEIAAEERRIRAMASMVGGGGAYGHRAKISVRARPSHGTYGR